MNVRNVLIVVSVIALFAVSAYSIAYIRPHLIGVVNPSPLDAIELCSLSSGDPQGCMSPMMGGWRGTIQYNSAGTDVKLWETIYIQDKFPYYGMTHIETRLVGMNGKPGNNLLAESAWDTPFELDGGCYYDVGMTNYYTRGSAGGKTCDEIGGVGYKVIGYEKLATPIKDKYGHARKMTYAFSYDLKKVLRPGFYYVQPIVVSNGLPNDGTEYAGDGSLISNQLLQNPRWLYNDTAIYFALAPMP